MECRGDSNDYLGTYMTNVEAMGRCPYAGGSHMNP